MSGFVTVTLTVPAAPAGVVAVIVVPFTTEMFPAAFPPTLTVAPATKFVPVIVIGVPPTVDPVAGDTFVTAGAGNVYVNPFVNVAACASGFVTTTFIAPAAACAGVVAVIEVGLTTVTPVAAVPPMLTVAPVTKFVPVMVIGVPPVVSPVFGDTVLIVGAGSVYVNPFVNVAACASGLVATTFTAPAACVGVVAVIDVALTTVTLVAAIPPTVTVAPATKFVPVIVIAVPPAVSPVFGETVLIVGAGNTYV